jgi:hypothetical protein
MRSASAAPSSPMPISPIGESAIVGYPCKAVFCFAKHSHTVCSTYF